MASEKKQYGLIIPAKRKVIGPTKLPKPSVFADDSSSDEEGDTVRGKYGSSVWRENRKNAERLGTHGSVVKALSEDPSVFEYDSLYDKMQDDKRKADPRLQKKDTKSKYIAHLKKVADKRKLEQELIYERKVQREMEKEGQDPDQTEAYLTGAYRQKLLERKALEEELKKEEEIEKANDVTKQKDLTRFHKHLFDRIASGPSGDQNTDKQKSPSKTPTKDSERRGSHSTPRHHDRGRRESGEKDRRFSTDSNERRRSSDGNERRRSYDSNERRRHSSHGDERESGRKRLSQSGSKEELTPPQENTGKDDQNVSIAEEDKTRTDSVSSTEAARKEVDKEERRKMASAKRTNEEAQLSARERYLARKKRKLSASTGQ